MPGLPQEHFQRLIDHCCDCAMSERVSQMSKPISKFKRLLKMSLVVRVGAHVTSRLGLCHRLEGKITNNDPQTKTIRESGRIIKGIGRAGRYGLKHGGVRPELINLSPDWVVRSFDCSSLCASPHFFPSSFVSR